MKIPDSFLMLHSALWWLLVCLCGFISLPFPLSEEGKGTKGRGGVQFGFFLLQLRKFQNSTFMQSATNSIFCDLTKACAPRSLPFSSRFPIPAGLEMPAVRQHPGAYGSFAVAKYSREFEGVKEIPDNPTDFERFEFICGSWGLRVSQKMVQQGLNDLNVYENIWRTPMISGDLRECHWIWRNFGDVPTFMWCR